MRVSSEATTPNGNKYRISRTGRICATAAGSAYGIVRSLDKAGSKAFNDDLKYLQRSLFPNMHMYPKTRKTALVVTGTAICALIGFIAGGIFDFISNKIARNNADKEAKNN